MNDIPRTPRTTLKRLPERGFFDRGAVDAILDEAFICHVGFALEGRPFVIPTSYVRVGDRLFIHGSAASRMQLSLSKGVPACVTVTLVDGLVLARSAFHHSINYRSVVIFGMMTAVTDEKEKLAALHAFTEHIIPGRWSQVREPSPAELKATSVLSIDLNEASAKIRSGPPKDDKEDYSRSVWAGVLPLQTLPGTPIPDGESGAAVPEYVLSYSRKRNKS